MSDNRTTEALSLGQDFPPVAMETWEAAIQKDLKGADYEKKLVWHTDEGIGVRPYYRSDVLADLGSQTRSIPGEFPFVRGTGKPWEINPAGIQKENAIRADLILEAGADAVQQLGIAIAAGVEKLAHLSESCPIDQAAHEIQFVFAVGSMYFLEIAKLRAARMLWARVVEQFKSTNPKACLMNLHVRTARINKSLCDPHTNILRVTTEAMSAAIGGCNSLTVEPFGFDEHLALNIQRILAEEAHLNVVADPGGGSYYIEALTASLAREAWKFFQRIEASGGYSAALKANWLGEEIANSRASREKAIAFRCQTMVGVNNYPNLAEKGMAKAQLLNELEAPFPISRVAEPFEAIRERTTCHSIQTGCTPKVLVLKRGDLKMRNARANFARNFFGCAGFDIAESEDHTGAVADLIVLCSSDAEYLPFAQEVCAAVRSPVIVAGNPKDQIKELEATGVRGFIHSGSNAVEVLAHWQKRLGVTGEEA